MRPRLWRINKDIKTGLGMMYEKIKFIGVSTGVLSKISASIETI